MHRSGTTTEMDKNVCYSCSQQTKSNNPMYNNEWGIKTLASVRERTIPTKRPPLVGKVSAKS
jgi:hypothetical protein